MAGSITQIEAPMLMTVADERVKIPAKRDVISIIKNTANVIPTKSAAYFDRSLTNNL